MTKSHMVWVSILASSILLGGCATSRKVQVVQAGDHTMSCAQIMSELSRLDQAEQDIDSKKGATGTNVAAALFWLPGLAYTYYDAGQASQAINGRRSHLNALYNKKSCQ